MAFFSYLEVFVSSNIRILLKSIQNFILNLPSHCSKEIRKISELYKLNQNVSQILMARLIIHYIFLKAFVIDNYRK